MDLIVGVSRLNEIWARIKLAYAILTRPAKAPTIKFANGVVLDLNNNAVLLEKETTLHCLENLYLTSDKHVVLMSGCDPDPTRPGYLHSIWLNPDLDADGRPLKATEKHVTRGGHVHDK